MKILILNLSVIVCLSACAHNANLTPEERMHRQEVGLALMGLGNSYMQTGLLYQTPAPFRYSVPVYPVPGR